MEKRDPNDRHENEAKYDLQKVTAFSFLFFIFFSIFATTLGILAVIVLQPGTITMENDLLLAKLNNLTEQDQLKLKQESFRKSHYQTDSIYNILL